MNFFQEESLILSNKIINNMRLGVLSFYANLYNLNMNVLFFLIPKKEVEYLFITYTVRQALEKMEHHRYTSIPVIDKEGKYVETLSTSDLLWFIKEKGLSLEKAEKISVAEIVPYRPAQAIRIDKDISELLELITNQNFVPVEDDKGVFIGIVTRKAVIDFLKKKVGFNN